MPKIELISWDLMSAGGPDPAEVAKAIAAMSGAPEIHTYVVNDGTDNANILISDTPLDERRQRDALDIFTTDIVDGKIVPLRTIEDLF